MQNLSKICSAVSPKNINCKLESKIPAKKFDFEMYTHRCMQSPEFWNDTDNVIMYQLSEKVVRCADKIRRWLKRNPLDLLPARGYNVESMPGSRLLTGLPNGFDIMADRLITPDGKCVNGIVLNAAEQAHDYVSHVKGEKLLPKWLVNHMYSKCQKKPHAPMNLHKCQIDFGGI